MSDLKAYIGREILPNNKLGDWVTVDIKKPRVGVIVGKRGSGKTYTAGVFLEELMDKNKEMSYIVVDIMGIYWALKYPNTNSNELNKEGFAGLIEPKGYTNQVRVLVVKGDKGKYQEGTFDGTISITPNMVSFDVWLSVFSLSPEEPQAMLLKSILDTLHDQNYSIDDMINQLSEIQESETFSKQTLQSLRSKLLYAKSWGIFSDKGMTIHDLTLPGIVTVIDVSESSKPVSVLLVALIAEKVYEARKNIARIKSWEKVVGNKVIGKSKIKEIPQTWLIIEEAHNFLPSKSKTKASATLVRYVKEGRHPGCGLLLVTQEPSALDTKILKQIDFLMIHNLSHKDDIDAILEIAPSPVLKDIGNMLIRLKKGEAVLSMVGLEKSKKISIRPKHSIHVARADIAEEKATTGIDVKKYTSVWQQLDELKEENATLKKKVNELEGLAKSKEELKKEYEEEITKLKEEIKSKDEKIQQLNNELLAKEQKIRTLEDEIAKLIPTAAKIPSTKRKLLDSISKALIDTIVNDLDDDAKLVLGYILRHDILDAIYFKERLSGVRLMQAVKALDKKQMIRKVKKNGKEQYISNIEELIQKLSMFKLSDIELQYIKERIYMIAIPRGVMLEV